MCGLVEEEVGGEILVITIATVLCQLHAFLHRFLQHKTKLTAIRLRENGQAGLECLILF